MDSWLEEAYELAQNGGYDDAEGFYYGDEELDDEPEMEFY